MQSTQDSPSAIAAWKPWESYVGAYNLHADPAWGELFTRFVIMEANSRDGEVRALDVGAGKGISRKPRHTRRVREHVDELWGIEPNDAVSPPEGVFDTYQNALMETADLPESYFDIVYSFMVIEHLDDPEAFMRAVHRALKPGGVHLFMTPNGRHYFSRAVRLLMKLRIEEIMLRILRGRDSVERYHYPVQHKFNAPSQIEPICEATGFDPPSYVYVETNGPRPYFPGPLRAIWWLLQKKRELIRKPESLLEMYVRMTKKG